MPANFMDVIEERQEGRVSVSLPVVLDSSSGRREVRVSDVSMGGCYVDGLALVRQDEVVGLKIDLPDGRSESISGTVTYVHQGVGFGVRFNEMTEGQRAVVEQLVLAHGGAV